MMRKTFLGSMLLSAACLIGTVAAQNQPGGGGFAGTGGASTPTAAANPPKGPPAKLLPEVTVNTMPLTAVIQLLREMDDAFQAVVSFDPSAAPDSPTISELKLKNVSAESVLQLLTQAYPQISATAFPREGLSSIWVIRVVKPDMPASANGGAALFGSSEAPVSAMTTVHRLHEIVSSLAGDDAAEDTRKQTLASVLSLVKTALETAGDSNDEAILKLHEPTETLVFKGNSQRNALVAQALSNLMPPADVRARKSVETDIERLKAQREALRLQIDELNDRKSLGAAHSDQPQAQKPATTAPTTPKQ